MCMCMVISVRYCVCKFGTPQTKQSKPPGKWKKQWGYSYTSNCKIWTNLDGVVIFSLQLSYENGNLTQGKRQPDVPISNMFQDKDVLVCYCSLSRML